MSILFVLLIASLVLALGFLAGFVWAVRSGQFDDRCTPAMRVVADGEEPGNDVKTVDKEGTPKHEC